MISPQLDMPLVLVQLVLTPLVLMPLVQTPLVLMQLVLTHWQRDVRGPAPPVDVEAV